jgi:hypothetical protein
MEGKMVDFRKIETQEDLKALFDKTSFTKDDDFFSGMEINAPEKDEGEEEYQFIWVPECSHMGTLMSEDLEGNGEDALFVQTLVQMFKSGKLKLS